MCYHTQDYQLKNEFSKNPREILFFLKLMQLNLHSLSTHNNENVQENSIFMHIINSLILLRKPMKKMRKQCIFSMLNNSFLLFVVIYRTNCCNSMALDRSFAEIWTIIECFRSVKEIICIYTL